MASQLTAYGFRVLCTALVAGLPAGCLYDPLIPDCRVKCGDGGPCPGGMSCRDGMCRTADAVGPCEGACSQDTDCTSAGLCAHAVCESGTCVQKPAWHDGDAPKVCNPTRGECVEAEYCTSTSPDCPADELEPAGSVCRSAVRACDAAETCTGDASTCPEDQGAQQGSECPMPGEDPNGNWTLDSGETWTGLCGHDGSCTLCGNDPSYN